MKNLKSSENKSLRGFSYMKRMFIIFLLIINYGIYADYSSLTPGEKDRVDKAFRQSKFYKYYETLDKGKDRLLIKKYKKIKEKIIAPNLVEHYFDIHIDLIINDKVFKRIIRISFQTVTIIAPNIEQNIFDDILKIGGGGLSGLVVGFLIGVLIL